jgi:hypothetical protein
MTRQLGTNFWYYSAIRWPWGWQAIADGGDAPSVPGSYNDCTSVVLVAPRRTQLSDTPGIVQRQIRLRRLGGRRRLCRVLEAWRAIRVADQRAWAMVIQKSDRLV